MQDSMIDLKLEEDAHSPTKPRGETLITFDIKNTETLKKEDCVVSILITLILNLFARFPALSSYSIIHIIHNGSIFKLRIWALVLHNANQKFTAHYHKAYY